MTHTVLCIEDDEDNIHLMKRLLLRRPHAVAHFATSARDGIKVAGDERPDLILLDNRLPDATGLEVLRQLALSPTTAEIPVIIVSGDSGKSGMAELFVAGATDFLTKPYRVDEFLAMVDRYLPG